MPAVENKIRSLACCFRLRQSRRPESFCRFNSSASSAGGRSSPATDRKIPTDPLRLRWANSGANSTSSRATSPPASRACPFLAACIARSATSTESSPGHGCSAWSIRLRGSISSQASSTAFRISFSNCSARRSARTAAAPSASPNCRSTFPSRSRGRLSLRTDRCGIACHAESHERKSCGHGERWKSCSRIAAVDYDPRHFVARCAC